MPIGNKSFKSADAHRLALNTSDAKLLALCLLGTNSAAYRRESRAFCNYLICALKVAFLDLRDKLGNVNIYGTAVYTGHIFTVKTAKRLVDSRRLIIAESYLVKVASADKGLLGRHLVLFR
jgi:hypothetical protein